MAEILVELDDGRSLQHLEESNLAVGGLLVFRVQIVEINFFKRVLLAVEDVAVQGDAASGTLAERPDFLVLSEPRQLLRDRSSGRGRFPVLFLLGECPALLHANRLDQIVCGSQLLTNKASKLKLKLLCPCTYEGTAKRSLGSPWLTSLPRGFH